MLKCRPLFIFRKVTSIAYPVYDDESPHIEEELMLNSELSDYLTAHLFLNVSEKSKLFIQLFFTFKFVMFEDLGPVLQRVTIDPHQS